MIRKNIIVTGGTDGIGLALVKKLLEKDHYVYIVGKNAEKGNSVLNEIKNSKLDFFQCDLSEKSEIKKLLQTLNKIPSIDVLINNAGSIFDKRTLTKEGVEKTFALKDIHIVWKGSGVNEIGYDKNTNKEYIFINEKYYRPAEVDLLIGDPTKANTVLNWKPEISFEKLIAKMVEKDC